MMKTSLPVKKEKPAPAAQLFSKSKTNPAAFQFADRRSETTAQLQRQKEASGFSTQQSGSKNGLPHQLKSGIESLSGISMNDVKVHYNSSAPAQLQAHAYAKGSDIHLASGQEKHLPHEAWHVVQQKQGRVQPTMQLKGIAVNDNRSLEREADTMGQRALNQPAKQLRTIQRFGHAGIVQRVLTTQIHPQSHPVRPADNAKLLQVVKYLRKTGEKFNTRLKTIQLVVVRKYGMNPASTSMDNSGQHIIVKVSEWFVRMSSVGDLVGMIAHEIGVHTLADDQMTKKGREEEWRNEHHPSNIRVGRHIHTITPWTGSGKPRQQDHTNVGRDTGVGEQSMNMVRKPKSKKNSKKVSVSVLNERAQIYAKVMLSLGDAIDKDGILSQKERDKRIHDLLNSFLFDYARIIATDDTPRRIVKTHLIAQVYNWYRNTIVRRYAGKHKWLNRPNVQPVSSGWGLRAYLIAKASQAALEQGRTTLPGRVLETVATPVTYVGSGLMNLGGRALNTVSEHTPEMVKTGLNTVGGYVGSGLRGLDHAYGEVENVVQNVISVPLSVIGSAWSWMRGK